MHDTIEGIDEIRGLADQFAAERLRPNLERWDHERDIDAGIWDELADLGFHGMLVPETHGGLGFGATTFATVLDRMAWGEPAVAFALLASGAAAAALREGPDAARSRWLEKLADGSITGAMPLAGGADRLRATRAGDGWVLDGAIGWVLRGPNALLVTPAAAEGGTALFCVPLDAPGVAITRREDTLGLRSARIDSLELSGVQIGVEARLDDPAAEAVRVTGYIGTAAIANGIADAALQHAIAYADQREQFDRRIRMFQGIRMKLADMKVRVDAADAIIRGAATAGTAAAAAGARVFASETAMWVTTQAVQIFGGYGYMRDYPVEKTMRDAKATEVLTETNDALRETVAAALYSN